MDRNDIEYVNVNTLRVNGYVIIFERPCEILGIIVAKTGKHGSAKAHITAKDIFTGKKVETIMSTSDKVAVPIVKKVTYVLLGIEDNYVSLIDQSGKNKRDDVKIPTDEELGNKIKNLFSGEKEVLVTVLTALDESMIISCTESKD
jgi:translation initiation factor 5A